MFILRKIDSKGTSNHLIGETYVKTNLPFVEKEDWQKCLKTLDWITDEKILNSVECIIYDVNGKSIPLFKGNQYYIMTESGKTFEKITL